MGFLAPNPAKDIKKQQNTAIKILGLANVIEVACGSSFNLVRIINYSGVFSSFWCCLALFYIALVLFFLCS